MKKIISFLVVAMLLAGCVFAAIPASAATKTFEVDWTALAFTIHNENGTELDEFTFLNSFEVTKTATTLGVSRTSGGIQSNSYISTSQFDITSETDYTYEVMAKNNNTTKYSGVPFAIDTDGMVYFIYGSFDNNNDSDDSQSGKSYVIPAKGDFDNKYPNTTKDELNAMYFEKLQQTDGFASFKFEYNGLTVSIYAKNTSGSYVQIGEDVPLPEGSKLAFGVFSRDNSNGGNRTTTVKNAKITGNNDAAVNNMVLASDNGASELKLEIARAENDYLEVDYTKTTFSAYKTALEAAKAVAEDSFSTADEVSAAAADLQVAISDLELADPDFTELEEAIEEAEGLKENKYTDISYNMVVDAVDEAKELIDTADVKQSQVNAALETLKGRIDGLVLVEGAEDDEEEEEDADDEGDANTDAPATQAPIPQAPVTNVVPTPGAKKGCKSAVGTTACVIALVSTLGTALVIKKKD